MKTYSIMALAIFALASCSTGHTEEKHIPRAPKAPEYPLVTVAEGGITTELKLPAQLAAYQEVSIFPKVNGYVKTVQVDLGSNVARGALLMTLDAPELEENMTQARERYAHAQAEAALDKEHYERLLEASQTPGAVSVYDLSAVKSKMEAANALCNAEKANWQMQQTMRGYLQVAAPFAGIITVRNVHPGALVSNSAKDIPMLELKETDRLRLQVDVPEAGAGALSGKDSLTFYLSAFPGKRFSAPICRKSSNVNPQFRSERIEADIDNKDGMLSPGMYADVLLESHGDAHAFYVPRTAVVTSTEQQYVLKCHGSAITKVAVSTGAETADKVQVYGALTTGDQVIAKANDEIAERK